MFLVTFLLQIVKLFQIKRTLICFYNILVYLEDETLAGSGNTCRQNFIQRILDVNIGSHAYTVSRNDFMNKLKKVF